MIFAALSALSTALAVPAAVIGIGPFLLIGELLSGYMHEAAPQAVPEVSHVAP